MERQTLGGLPVRKLPGQDAHILFGGSGWNASQLLFSAIRAALGARGIRTSKAAVLADFQTQQAALPSALLPRMGAAAVTQLPVHK